MHGIYLYTPTYTLHPFSYPLIHTTLGLRYVSPPQMDEELDVDVESAEDVPDIGVEATAGTYDEGFHDSVSYTVHVCTSRT